MGPHVLCPEVYEPHALFHVFLPIEYHIFTSFLYRAILPLSMCSLNIFSRCRASSMSLSDLSAYLLKAICCSICEIIRVPKGMTTFRFSLRVPLSSWVLANFTS